jgi:hypothetical protein
VETTTDSVEVEHSSELPLVGGESFEVSHVPDMVVADQGTSTSTSF